MKTPGSKNLGNIIDNLPQEANKNLKEIKFLFGGLNSAVTNMENKFDNALEQHEKDFLSAYREHMLKVQGELNQYKNRTNEVDAQVRKDERIAVLEGSLFVFRQ